MGKVETALKEEIVRLARKEVRKSQAKTVEGVRRLKGSLAKLQTEVAALKRQLAGEQSKRRIVSVTQGLAPAELKKSRLSPRLIKKLRKRLKVTQSELARLVGVSAGAVGFWEIGKSQPRAAMRARLVALRRAGRRDVRRLLAESPAAKQPSGKARATKKTRKRKAHKK